MYRTLVMSLFLSVININIFYLFSFLSILYIVYCVWIVNTVNSERDTDSSKADVLDWYERKNASWGNTILKKENKFTRNYSRFFLVKVIIFFVILMYLVRSRMSIWMCFERRLNLFYKDWILTLTEIQSYRYWCWT